MVLFPCGFNYWLIIIFDCQKCGSILLLSTPTGCTFTISGIFRPYVFAAHESEGQKRFEGRKVERRWDAFPATPQERTLWGVVF